ncbi:MAG: PTS sugar transporter subunit IIA [Proteobacteria bacterium]|nr:PTS sugar transporter subunit IIA [Pseudomonadota bacterium]
MVLFGLEASDKAEGVRSLAALFVEKEYVKDTYADAVLQREEVFPTGLRMVDLHVAIPHCNVEHCIKAGIAVSVLSSPVKFVEMATNNQVVDTEIVFLLAIPEPKQQVFWLSRLATLSQTPGFLARLKNVPSSEEGYSVIFQAMRKEGRD